MNGSDSGGGSGPSLEDSVVGMPEWAANAYRCVLEARARVLSPAHGRVRKEEAKT